MPFLKSCSALLNRAVERPSSLSQSQAEQAMEKIIILIIALSIIFLIYKLKNKNLTLKEIAKKTFPKHIIIEKFDTVMICEINHRNEPDELAFLRLNTNRPKTIKKEGRRLKVEYQKMPTSTELKRDLKQVIK